MFNMVGLSEDMFLALLRLCGVATGSLKIRVTRRAK
jgi:hypothetical protein